MKLVYTTTTLDTYTMTATIQTPDGFNVVRKDYATKELAEAGASQLGGVVMSQIKKNAGGMVTMVADITPETLEQIKAIGVVFEQETPETSKRGRRTREQVANDLLTAYKAGDLKQVPKSRGEGLGWYITEPDPKTGKNITRQITKTEAEILAGLEIK